MCAESPAEVGMNGVTLGADADQALSGAHAAARMLRKSKSGIAATGSIAVGGGAYIIFTQETEEGMTVWNWEV